MAPHTEPSLTFTIPLGHSVHQMAETLCQPHSDWQKAEQVYLNTLAVQASDYYLQCLGFQTDWNHSHSKDFVHQALTNVADLLVKDYGRLECRYVLSDAATVHIPEEIWDDRIGYLVVQFDEELNVAEILGFLDRVHTTDIPLEQLRSLTELPAFLNQLSSSDIDQMAIASGASYRSFKATEPVRLSQWLLNQFEAAWKAVEDVFSPQQVALAWRTKEINRVKILNFDAQVGKEQVALLVGITPISDVEMDIKVQIRPTGSQTYLPNEVQVRLLNATGDEVGQAKAAITETIQLQFAGRQGERFSIEIASGSRSITETFVI